MDERNTAGGNTRLPERSELSERAEETIEAWEKKRAAEVGSDRRDDLSDDAEAGGP